MRRKGRVIAASAIVCLIAITLTYLESSHGNPVPLAYPTLPRITIEGNGTISPPDMPIKQVGEVYYLTGNISHYTIAIRRENITLDGQGFTLLGNETMAGIGITILANNVTVRNFVVKTFPVGIQPITIRGGRGVIPEGEGVDIINNTISDCNSAIALVYEANIHVSGNVLKDNDYSGIGIRQGCSNTIDGNIIMNNTDGIRNEETSQNTISNNIITENQNGANLNTAQSNIYTENSFTRNDYAVKLVKSSSNQFYLNNFIDNSVEVETSKSLYNSWNSTSLGNYWSAYNSTDSNGDGICDASYVIDANNTDNYPLMAPYNFEHNTRVPLNGLFMAALFSAVTVLVSVGLLVYFKKRKSEAESS